MRRKKAVCGKCMKFVKIKKLNNEINEVIFICKTHGDVTGYIEWR